MYINYNKIHSGHDFVNQIESLHDFVQRIVGTLSPANHHGVLTHGTILKLLLEPVDDERDPLVHHLVQIGRDPYHLRHHANLQNQTKVFFQHPGHEKKKNTTSKKLTHRQPVIEHTVAMVAAIFSRGAQPQHHLIPPPTFAQVLGKPCQVAFGQPFQLSHHLLAFVHGVKTLHPKHNLDLDLQGQHAAKRFISGINKSTAVHVENSVKHGMRSLCPVSFIHGFLGPIAYSRQDLASTLKRCTHGGHPLEFPLLVKFSHMISLHQSAPPIKSVNPVARSV